MERITVLVWDGETYMEAGLSCIGKLVVDDSDRFNWDEQLWGTVWRQSQRNLYVPPWRDCIAAAHEELESVDGDNP